VQGKVPLKSALHHWWPACVSKRWEGEDGKVGWLKSDGTHVRLASHRLGAIGNGHHIKLGRNGAPSHWDESFESEFDDADTYFPGFIDWLGQLPRLEDGASTDLRERFMPVETTDKELLRAVECVVSLAVRSPMNREASVSLAERLRGETLPRVEREALTGLNLRRRQKLIVDDIGTRAKFVVMFSLNREFVFGDGFYHNVQYARPPLIAPEMLAPITPWISVLICRPTQYMKNPQLSSIVLRDAEVDGLNLAVQVYSKNAVYFRDTLPAANEAYRAGEHRMFADALNPVSHLIHSVPGIPALGQSLFGPPVR
jgi:hypothetical protein